MALRRLPGVNVEVAETQKKCLRYQIELYSEGSSIRIVMRAPGEKKPDKLNELTSFVVKDLDAASRYLKARFSGL